MKHIVVLTGAGISAESGIRTFRDSDGLWEGHDVRDVATPEAWERNPELVQNFYNERRHSVVEAEPNAAHRALAELEKFERVSIITQNIDDLHERAGSTSVLHLHGEIRKARSTADENLLYEIGGGSINMGDLCELGSQLRPHVVWFGEAVPMMEPAAELASSADIFLVIGTSLAVYPAASLIDYVPGKAAIHLIDPKPPKVYGRREVIVHAMSAVAGVPPLVETLRAER